MSTPMMKTKSDNIVSEPFLTPVIQSHDMFFSCCDWETAMEVEKKGQTAFKSFHVNRGSHDIDSLFKFDNKRARKMSEKMHEAPISKFSD